MKLVKKRHSWEPLAQPSRRPSLCKSHLHLHTHTLSRMLRNYLSNRRRFVSVCVNAMHLAKSRVGDDGLEILRITFLFVAVSKQEQICCWRSAMRFLLQAAMAIGRRVAQQQQQHLGIGAQAVLLAWLRTGGWAIYHFAIFKTCHTWRCKMSKHATPCVAQMVSRSKYTVCCSCMARRTKPPLRLIGLGCDPRCSSYRCLRQPLARGGFEKRER